MKLKVKLTDNINKQTIEQEINVPDKDHLAAQIKYRANVFKPKKGQGSFKRKPKQQRNIADEEN